MPYYRSGGEQDTYSSLLSESVSNFTAGDKLHAYYKHKGRVPMNRVELNKEMDKLREERDSALIAAEVAQQCMNELMARRNRLEESDEDSTGQLLFDQMFGG